MLERIDNLPEGKKIFFASDFHLGVPTKTLSREREKKIVRWLDHVAVEAHTIFLLGDIFDFWFEYKNAIPKGFARLQGKLAELTDNGINVVFFIGNHDMWMFDYFTDELNIPIYREPQSLIINDKKLHIGHGDGLGPGDYSYKFIKKVFRSPFFQWLYARVHPNTGIAVANYFSRRSRINGGKKGEEKFMGDKEFLWAYCKEIERKEHHDFYVFGHRHLRLELEVGEQGKYFNLGEWVNHSTYGEFDGKTFKLLTFEK
ncbi:MAG: UDP-2,3-diacylglucosamine diphosphatase [Bacteroidota bacterium]